jgi:hypothetical protein
METTGLGSPDVSPLAVLFIKTGLEPVLIFKAAFDYSEVRVPLKRIRDSFVDCMREGRIPLIVEKFCLAVLANQTRLNPL